MPGRMVSAIIRALFCALRFFLRTMRAGIPPIVFVGVLYWVFDNFFSKMDLAAQRIFFGLPLTNESAEYPGLGILILLLLAFAIGLPFLPGKKRIVDYLSFWKIIGTATGKKLRSWHLFEIQTRTIIKFGPGPDREFILIPIFEKALVHITRQWVTNDDGSQEELIVYDALIGTAPVLQSGPLPRLDPRCIEFVLENNLGQFVLFLFTLGRAGYIWNRRRFNPKEFVPD